MKSTNPPKTTAGHRTDAPVDRSTSHPAVPRVLSRTLLIVAIALPFVPSLPRSTAAQTPARPDFPTQVDSRLAITQNIIQSFLERLVSDPAACALLRKHKLTLECVVPEADLRFYVGCADQQVCFGLGAPERTAGVVLTSSASVLDSYLSGSGDTSHLRVDVHLSLLQKLALKKDLETLRTALVRNYLAARKNISLPMPLIVKDR